MAKEDAKFGDYVKIKTPNEETEGLLLESPDAEFYLVKLKSGYNVGVRKESVIGLEVVKAAEKESKGKIQMPENKNLPKIDMIITGGTISSRLDVKTGAVRGLTSPEDLFKFYPEMFEIANVKRLEMPFMVLSENMNYLHWKKIAESVEASLNDKEVSGVIITHGTDILHYTSAILSFFFPKPNKPIVLTFSQRSTDRASSDAALNLVCAARAATSDIAEIMIVGHANTDDNFCYAIKGTRARKMHSSRRDTFHAMNSAPLAKIFPDKKEIEKMSEYRTTELIGEEKKKSNKFDSDIVFNDKVALLKFYPGQNPEILEYYSQKYEGLIIEGTGFGHVATSEAGEKSWIGKIKKAIENGLMIFMVTQTLGGRSNGLVYSAGRELEKAGIIYLEDILPEVALMKLGWVLGHKQWHNNKDKIKEKMLENISGEISERSVI